MNKDHYIVYHDVSPGIKKIIIDREEGTVKIDNKFYVSKDIENFENNLCAILIEEELQGIWTESKIENFIHNSIFENKSLKSLYETQF